MNTISNLWRKLRSKKYREEFVAAQVKRGIPFQIQTLMKVKNLSQVELARRSNLTQGAISRAANPDYGNLTLNTIIRVAAGFDVAFVGKFVPFSELAGWFKNVSEESGTIKTFAEEDEEMSEVLGRVENATYRNHDEQSRKKKPLGWTGSALGFDNNGAQAAAD